MDTVTDKTLYCPLRCSRSGGRIRETLQGTEISHMLVVGQDRQLDRRGCLKTMEKPREASGGGGSNNNEDMKAMGVLTQQARCSTGGTSDHVPDKGTLHSEVQNDEKATRVADGTVLGVWREW